MTIWIDGIKELKYKSGKALRFNVYIEIVEGGENGYEEERTYVAIPNFRWMDGCLHPPVLKQQGRYNEVVFLGQSLAEEIYTAFADGLEKETFGKEYPVMKMDIAIEPLVQKSKMCRTFPGLLKRGA